MKETYAGGIITFPLVRLIVWDSDWKRLLQGEALGLRWAVTGLQSTLPVLIFREESSSASQLGSPSLQASFPPAPAGCLGHPWTWLITSFRTSLHRTRCDGGHPSRGGWHPAGMEAEGPASQHLFKTAGKATHVLSNRWNFAFSFIYLRMNFSLKRPLCRWRQSTRGISNFQQEYYTFVFITICV